MQLYYITNYIISIFEELDILNYDVRLHEGSISAKILFNATKQCRKRASLVKETILTKRVISLRTISRLKKLFSLKKHL